MNGKRHFYKICKEYLKITTKEIADDLFIHLYDEVVDICCKKGVKQPGNGCLSFTSADGNNLFWNEEKVSLEFANAIEKWKDDFDRIANYIADIFFGHKPVVPDTDERYKQ